MFNLDSAIANWRRQMNAAGVQAPRVLDELESHLREDIQNQMRSGIEPEQAFAAAVERMGTAARLKQEFEKVSKQRKRNLLRISSIVGGTLFAYSAVFATWILARRAGRMEITTIELLLVSGSMFATMFFGFIGRRFARFLPIVVNDKLQAAYIAAAVFLGAGLTAILWNHLSFDNLAQAQIILLWTMSPWLGLGHCFSAWCEKCSAARKKLIQ